MGNSAVETDIFSGIYPELGEIFLTNLPLQERKDIEKIEKNQDSTQNNINKIIDIVGKNYLLLSRLFPGLTQENVSTVLTAYGASYGDEGKGKVVTALAKFCSNIFTTYGGGNAGHTVYEENEKIVLHELPGGSINKLASVYLSQGRVINISGIIEEIELLESHGIPSILEDNDGNTEAKYTIAGGAHVILDSLQKKLDKKVEEAKGKNSIGTTVKGIGPAYALEALRTSFNINMLLKDDLTQVKDLMKINVNLFWIGKDEKQQLLAQIYEELESEKEKLIAYINAGKIVIDEDNSHPLNSLHERVKSVIEISQSSLLSIVGGNYPLVTSSITGPDGVAPALQIPTGRSINPVAIFKSFKTCVGKHINPTLCKDSTGTLNDTLGEFGATTGRPRTVSYPDAVEMRHVIRHTEPSALWINKLDQLKDFPGYKIALGYITADGERIEDQIPGNKDKYKNMEVVYSDVIELPENICGCKDYDELPESYKNYVKYLAEVLNYDGPMVFGTGKNPDDFLVYANGNNI